MSKIKSFVAVVLALTMVLGLAACGGGSNGGARNDIIMVTRTEPSNLDPHNNTYLTAFMLEPMIYDRLVGKTQDGEIYGILAESWEYLDDTTIRFKLHQGVKFHDGTDLTADDVVFSIQRGETATGSKTFLQYFDGKNCKAVDKYTVDIKTYNAFAPALTYLASARGCILSKAYVEKVGDDVLAREPMGSGKFKFVEWTIGDKVVLEKNPDYWGEEKALVDKFTCRFVSEDASRAIEIQTGACDLALYITAENIENIEKADGVHVETTNSFEGHFVGLQTSKYPFLQDVRVRRALAYALDRDAIVQAVDRGIAETMQSHFSSSLPYWIPVYTYDYNPEKAKELLNEAGWDWDTDIEMFTGSAGQTFMEAVANYWKQIGVKCHITVSSDSTVTSSEKGVPVYYLTSNANSGDPDHGVFNYTSKSNGVAVYQAEEIDRLLAAEKAEIDPAKREQLFHELQKVLNDYCGLIPVSTPKCVYGVKDDLKGFVPDHGYTPDLTKLHW